MFEDDDLFLEPYFQKDDLRKIADDVRTLLAKHEIKAQLWSISYQGLSFHVTTQVEDITQAVWNLYKSNDIIYQVCQGFEPSSRIRLLHVTFKPKWFMPADARKG